MDTLSPATTVGVVIPAHNEADNLARTLPALLQHPTVRFAEIVVVDDGSRDATAEVVRQFVAADPRVRLVTLPANQGKGAAVRAGLLAATSDAILYTDADLIYHLGDLPRWLEQLAQVDIVNGNRRLPESVFHVPTRLFPYVAKRARFGLCFNWFVRRFLPITTADTQSGLKLFRRAVAQRIAVAAREQHFSFDVECFALAQVWGYRVADVPVRLDYRNEISRVRLLRDGFRMLCAVLAIRRRVRTWQKQQPRVLIVNADDYGISPAISAGILEAHTNGIVNSLSIVVNAPDAAPAVQRLKEFPTLLTGVHLNATWGVPLTPDGKVLVGTDGEFSQGAFLFHYCVHPRKALRALAVEWEAQIVQLLNWGQQLHHLDSHHHVHLLPGVQSIALRLARKYNIPRIRASHDPAFCSSLRKSILYLCGRRLACRARRVGLTVAHHFRGGAMMHASNKGQALSAILQSIPPGTTEIYCHPGHLDLLLKDTYREERVAELQALTADVHQSGRQIPATAFPPATA